MEPPRPKPPRKVSPPPKSDDELARAQRKREEAERAREAAVLELERERVLRLAQEQDFEERLAGLEKSHSRPPVGLAPPPEAKSGLWAFLGTKAGQGLVVGLTALLSGGGGAGLWSWVRGDRDAALQRTAADVVALKHWAGELEKCRSQRERVWNAIVRSGIDGRFVVRGGHPGWRDVEFYSEKMGIVGVKPEDKPIYRVSVDLSACPQPP